MSYVHDKVGNQMQLIINMVKEW